MNVRAAFNVHELGDANARPMLFAHGFGCEQKMWRHVAPAFAASHRPVLFDAMGLGGSDLTYYDPIAYSSLDAYADDVLRICEDLDLRDVVFVGHSVSATIGLIAARQQPERFSELVLVCPSPRYVDDPDTGYRGGFSRADIDGLLATLSENYMGWAHAMAPVIMGLPPGDAQTDELADTFCRADPQIAKRFAVATFLGDHRAELPRVPTRSLVIQTTNDRLAPRAVGQYVAETMPDAQLVEIDAVGHCPNMSAPAATIAAIKAFL